MAVKVGPTGEYPEGKMNAEDEGELRIAIGAQDGKVMVVFGAKVTWFAMSLGVARGVAQAILDKAEEIERQRN